MTTLPTAAEAAPPPSLRRRTAMPAWVSLLLRLALALALIGLALAVNWMGRGGLRDNADGQISFPDVLYFTMITITTVGYGDIVPVTERARLFDAFGLTPIRLFVWLIFLGTAYDFFLRGLWERWRMALLQRNLHGHVLIAGFGVSGSEAAAELLRSGVPAAALVAIDPDPAAARAAEAAGAAVLAGDATRDAVLQAAQVARAQAVVVAAGRDDTSILIVLTARRLAPQARIGVVIRSQDNEALARQAGADTVINPASFAGLLLAGATHGPHIADYLADLAGSHGTVALRERPAAADEVGRPLGAISTGKGLRIYRGGQAFGFWAPEAMRLEPGDLIVEVTPRSGDAPREPQSR
jgi:voltage-gated potassium channel